jgi:hypothetical protein
MYEYGTLKPAEVILRGSVGRGKIMEGWNKPGFNTCIYGNVTEKPPV